MGSFSKFGNCLTWNWIWVRGADVLSYHGNAAMKKERVRDIVRDFNWLRKIGKIQGRYFPVFKRTYKEELLNIHQEKGLIFIIFRVKSDLVVWIKLRSIVRIKRWRLILMILKSNGKAQSSCIVATSQILTCIKYCQTQPYKTC